MACCDTSIACPYLECAPCPPFFVVDIYQILVNVSLSQNLSEDEYIAIAKRCNIQGPTTTTTTTTTTTSRIPTTNSSTQKTTSKNKVTSNKPATTSGSQNKSSITDSNTTVTAYIPNSTKTTESNLSVTSTSTTQKTTTSVTTGGSTRRHRWPYCNDVCLIIVITTSICVFLVVLVILALCCRRKPTHDKTDSRSNSSQRLFVNGTYDRTSSIECHGGSVWRHSPGIDNLAYRKSMEVREPLKYMEYEQNWDDLDYYGAGSNKNIKDGSLKSDKTSQRSDSSPRRKRRPNKDRRKNSMDGMVFIPLDERRPRSLPRIPTETQNHCEKADYIHVYPDGVKFSSLPRTHLNQNGADHRRSRSDGQTRSRSKQRPRSFDQLYHPSYDNGKGDKIGNGAVIRNQKSKPNPELNHINNILPTKDNNLKRLQGGKSVKSSPKANNVNQNANANRANQRPNNVSHRGQNRGYDPASSATEDIFPSSDRSASPKFYPPYRDSNNQSILFTTRL